MKKSHGERERVGGRENEVSSSFDWELAVVSALTPSQDTIDPTNEGYMRPGINECWMIFFPSIER